MSITPENNRTIYLNNFYTDYYLTKIEMNDSVIKMSRIKKVCKYEIQSRKLQVTNVTLDEALRRYRTYNFDYELKRKDIIYKQQKKVEKGIMVGFIVGAVVIICL
jgi:hypothetical protein